MLLDAIPILTVGKYLGISMLSLIYDAAFHFFVHQNQNLYSKKVKAKKMNKIWAIQKLTVILI